MRNVQYSIIYGSFYRDFGANVFILISMLTIYFSNRFHHENTVGVDFELTLVELLSAEWN